MPIPRRKTFSLFAVVGRRGSSSILSPPEPWDFPGSPIRNSHRSRPVDPTEPNASRSSSFGLRPARGHVLPSQWQAARNWDTSAGRLPPPPPSPGDAWVLDLVRARPALAGFLRVISAAWSSAKCRRGASRPMRSICGRVGRWTSARRYLRRLVTYVILFPIQ